MIYLIKIQPSSRRQLKKLPQKVRYLVGKLIDSLGENPRPHGCKKLKGKRNLYRVKGGNYRVIYSIEDDVLLVTVVWVGFRKEAYIKLNRL